MRAPQRIVALLVTERPRIEPHHREGPAVVVVVATTARRLRVARAAVKTGVRRDIGADRPVTGDAELVLAGAVEGGVAVFAAPFGLGMRLRQRPGRNQPLDHVLRHRRRGEAQRERTEQNQEAAHARRLSVEVNGDHVDHGRHDQQDEQRQVQDVPGGKKPIENREI